MSPADFSKYPRDLAGYGRDPPDPRWPGGARIAVQFVVNYEEGGERNILHGDATSEAFLSDVLGAAPWPGARHMNVESMYEYGSRAGFWRLWRLFTKHDVPVTVLEKDEHFVGGLETDPSEAHQRGVHGVARRAGHEADDAMLGAGHVVAHRRERVIEHRAHSSEPARRPERICRWNAMSIIASTGSEARLQLVAREGAPIA